MSSDPAHDPWRATPVRTPPADEEEATRLVEQPERGVLCWPSRFILEPTLGLEPQTFSLPSRLQSLANST